MHRFNSTRCTIRHISHSRACTTRHQCKCMRRSHRVTWLLHSSLFLSHRMSPASAPRANRANNKKTRRRLAWSRTKAMAWFSTFPRQKHRGSHPPSTTNPPRVLCLRTQCPGCHRLLQRLKPLITTSRCTILSSNNHRNNNPTSAGLFDVFSLPKSYHSIATAVLPSLNKSFLHFLSCLPMLC